MDPRHPEEAVNRLESLMIQYRRIEAKMREATVTTQLAQLEREGGLVVQEICLVAPRIHEAMMQTSRQRRHDLSHGVVEKPVEKSEPTEEKEVVPKKETTTKKTTKKKTTKKAKK